MRSRAWVVVGVVALVALLPAACSVDKVFFSQGSSVDAAIPDAALDAPMPSSGIRSCMGLAKTCGPRADEDCCQTIELPGGSFFRSFDVAADTQSGSQNAPATLQRYKLDRFEVTVGRFRAFVAAGRGTQTSAPTLGEGAHPAVANSGWRSTYTPQLLASTSALTSTLRCSPTATWTDTPGANENRPINCVSWYEAFAFCIWDGGFLPTEAEWNFAATGGDSQRAFPWSSPASSVAIDGTRASYMVPAGCVGDGAPACTVDDLRPVGSKPAGAGRWSHDDLGGNVAEWALDSPLAYPVPCMDCAALDDGTSKIFRGGAFERDQREVRSGYRITTAASTHVQYLGVRCARPVAPPL